MDANAYQRNVARYSMREYRQRGLTRNIHRLTAKGQDNMKTSTAWGVVTVDGLLCKNLIRGTRKWAMNAQLKMFPFHTRETLKMAGFKLRKLTITYRD